ncbi:MAG: serine/threonine-protein phosphatase [Gammaproteobacteria bacterium]|nr:serine/threonine-protein phosphatase [Gammaproteobacteria bacterium]
MNRAGKRIAVVDLAHCSLTGDRRNNQDRCLMARCDNALLLGIADGMGGHPGGDKAAQIFVDTCRSQMRQQSGPISEPRAFLLRLLQLSHRRIQRYGQRNTPPILPRTTAVLALLQDGLVRWVHAGDSRFYLFRERRTAVRTTDHSQVERLRQQGLIKQEEMAAHPARNLVTRCLGGDHELVDVPDYGEIPLAADDRVLLCSDGLWSSIPDLRLIGALCDEGVKLAGQVTALAREAAASRAPESDNVSLVACRIGLVDPG